ncbi:hypothetical protein D1007_17704 [Hordeum vulgare]|nr:hypothetical protein D1007_17704 [Hordeum vulgare]
MQLTALKFVLFLPDRKFNVPTPIIPLCNKSSTDSILVILPTCDAHGVDPSCKPLAPEEVLQWCNNHMKVCVRDKGNLVCDTTEEEVDFIARRWAEAGLTASSSSSGGRRSTDA